MPQMVDSRYVVATDGSTRAIGLLRKDQGTRVLLRFPTGPQSYEEKWFTVATGDPEDGSSFRLASLSYLPSTADRTKLDGIEAGAINALAGDGLRKTGSTLDIIAADSTITVNADSIQVGTVPVAQVSGAVPTTSANGLPSSTATATRNITGTVEVAETATNAAVTFATAESDALYGIIATVETVSGGTSAANGLLLNGISSKTTSGFTLNSLAAPGAGVTVTWRWLLVR